MDDDDFDKQYIYALTLKCADCGLVFRKEHEYVCPVCHSRKVSRPAKEEFDRFYEDSENSTKGAGSAG